MCDRLFSAGEAGDPTYVNLRDLKNEWTAQAIYARAFYAAGETFAPMLAGTIEITRSLLAAVVSFAGVELLLHLVPRSQTQLSNLITIALGALAWPPSAWQPSTSQARRSSANSAAPRSFFRRM
jgi:hypothetical protein